MNERVCALQISLQAWNKWYKRGKKRRKVRKPGQLIVDKCCPYYYSSRLFVQAPGKYGMVQDLLRQTHQRVSCLIEPLET